VGWALALHDLVEGGEALDVEEDDRRPDLVHLLRARTQNPSISCRVRFVDHPMAWAMAMPARQPS